MPDQELLEEYSLYRKKEVMLPTQRQKWPKPAVRAACSTCQLEQTFNMINEYQQYDEEIGRMVAVSQGIRPSSTVRLVYSCAGCRQSRRYYLILALQQPAPSNGGVAPPRAESKATIIKVGQYPAYDVRPDPQLAAKLGVRVSVYKKGLVCESQGYGIAAFAYYRRIVENLIDELLDEILPLIPEVEREEYTEALERTKASHNASDKIDLVKHLLPAVLRPGGANPLSLLHGSLSEGIHALSDEECLMRAVSIREVLVFLVHQISETRVSAERFSKHIKQILDTRSGER